MCIEYEMHSDTDSRQRSRPETCRSESDGEIFTRHVIISNELDSGKERGGSAFSIKLTFQIEISYLQLT